MIPDHNSHVPWWAVVELVVGDNGSNGFVLFLIVSHLEPAIPLCG